jgi:hypothetical protein
VRGQVPSENLGVGEFPEAFETRRVAAAAGVILLRRRRSSVDGDLRGDWVIVHDVAELQESKYAAYRMLCRNQN